MDSHTKEDSQVPWYLKSGGSNGDISPYHCPHGQGNISLFMHLSNTSGANTGLIAKADTVVKHQI